MVQSSDTLSAGTLDSDLGITDIPYSGSDSLATTPSRFPAFAYGLKDRFPSSTPIPEPQSTFLALFGLFFSLSLRRRAIDSSFLSFPSFPPTVKRL